MNYPGASPEGVNRVRNWAKNRHLLGLDSVVFPIYNGFMDIDLSKLEGFEWDKGNESKSLKKHGITPLEAEEAFFNVYVVFPDQHHSVSEPRYGMYSQTNAGKILFISFTIRGRLARVISARLANKKERESYEQTLKRAA